MRSGLPHSAAVWTPRTARRYRDGTVEIMPSDDVAVGDPLLVASGDAVLVDSTVTADAAVPDESALTGEARPAEHARGDLVPSGVVVKSGGILERLAQCTTPR